MPAVEEMQIRISGFTSAEPTLAGAIALQADPFAPLAILSHPHPAFGGTMDNKVVHHLARRLNEHGLSTLRYQFRGVGQSEGVHDGRGAEEADVLAAIVHAAQRTYGPVWLVGYSFGSWMSAAAAGRWLRTGARGVDPGRLQRLVLIAPPLSIYEIAVDARVETVAMLGDRDEFCSTDAFAAWADGLRRERQGVPNARPVHTGVLPGCVHGFHQCLRPLWSLWQAIDPGLQA